MTCLGPTSFVLPPGCKGKLGERQGWPKDSVSSLAPPSTSRFPSAPALSSLLPPRSEMVSGLKCCRSHPAMSTMMLIFCSHHQVPLIHTCDCENPKRSLNPAVREERCESVLFVLDAASGIVVLVVVVAELLGFTDNFKDSDPLSVSGLKIIN